MTTITDTLTPSERALETERDIEAAKLRAHRTQTQRAQGVRWSGMEPEQFPAISEERLLRLASQRAARDAIYKESDEARFRKGVSETRKMALAVCQLIEAMNDAYNRGDGSSRKVAPKLKDAVLGLSSSSFALISDCDGAEFERGRK